MEFPEVRKQCQEGLIRFLKLEIDLADTFRAMSETVENAAHRPRLLSAVDVAVGTIARFESKIGDTTVRSDLRRKAAELQKAALRAAAKRIQSRNARSF